MGDGEAAAFVRATVILVFGSGARRDLTDETDEVNGGMWMD
jgi:hypothetical protein